VLVPLDLKSYLMRVSGFRSTRKGKGAVRYLTNYCKYEIIFGACNLYTVYKALDTVGISCKNVCCRAGVTGAPVCPLVHPPGRLGSTKLKPPDSRASSIHPACLATLRAARGAQ
jgi:hypothetical protein